jgi:hypothetical protein
MRTLVAHLGLGDSILLSGAAVVLAKRYGGLRFPCYEQYEASVKSFFVNHPEIEVYTVPNQGPWWGCPPLECFRIVGDPILSGLYAGQPEPRDCSFPEWFYRQLDVPYSERWDSCPIWPATNCVSQQEIPDILHLFLHDDAAREFNIDDNRLPPLEPFLPLFTGESILRYRDMIEYASEVHVIDSCFYHLVNCLNPTGKLFLHRYARAYSDIFNNYPSRQTWEIIT